MLNPNVRCGAVQCNAALFMQGEAERGPGGPPSPLNPSLPLPPLPSCPALLHVTAAAGRASAMSDTVWCVATTTTTIYYN